MSTPPHRLSTTSSTRPELVEAAWEKVRLKLNNRSVRQPPADRITGCLTWVGSLTGNGYGLVSMPRALQNEGWPANSLVHRVACFLTNGPPPFQGAQSRHLCHNKPCIEPEHLAWGSPADNSADTAKAARWKSKLTREQVAELRTAHASGSTQQSLASKYGISPQTVWSIVHGRTWAWLLPQASPPASPSNVNESALLTAELALIAPPKPEGVSGDDYITKWVLEGAASTGVTTAEFVDAASRPGSIPNDRYVAAVLDLASGCGITTGEADAILSRRIPPP